MTELDPESPYPAYSSDHSSDADAAPLLELRKVNKSFGVVHVLHDVDFAVYPGQVTALVGDNGAGKSTLVKVIAGIYGRDNGEYLFNGEPVHVNGPRDVADLGTGERDTGRVAVHARHRARVGDRRDDHGVPRGELRQHRQGAAVVQRLDGQAAAVVSIRLAKSQNRIRQAPVIVIPCLYLADLDTYPSWLEIVAKAVVTKRIKPLKINGKEVHTVGIPLHWGFDGLTKPGYLTNTLTPFVGDERPEVEAAEPDRESEEGAKKSERRQGGRR